MELIAVIIDCDHNGEVRPRIMHQEVKKETAKLLNLKGSLCHKVQYYKTEMGAISVEQYQNQFKVWCVDIKQDKGHLDEMVDKVMARIKEIIRSRKDNILSWEEGMVHAIELLQG